MRNALPTRRTCCPVVFPKLCHRNRLLRIRALSLLSSENGVRRVHSDGVALLDAWERIAGCQVNSGICIPNFAFPIFHSPLVVGHLAAD